MKKYMVVLTEDEMKILKENRINLNRKVSLDELTDMSSDEALSIIKNYLYMDIDEMDKEELKNFEDTMESFAYDRGSFAALVKKYIKEHDDETETRYSDGRGTPLFNLQKKCFAPVFWLHLPDSLPEKYFRDDFRSAHTPCDNTESFLPLTSSY